MRIFGCETEAELRRQGPTRAYQPATGSSFEPGTINNAAGEISLIGDVFASGVTGSGNLVDVTFRALSTGTTDIAVLGNSDLQFFDSNLNPIVVDDSVTTSPGAWRPALACCARTAFQTRPQHSGTKRDSSDARPWRRITARGMLSSCWS
jgi:hypothetical protein